MTDDNVAEASEVSIDNVEAMLAGRGYEVSRIDNNLVKVRDTESGITIRTALQGNVLFLTVPCALVLANAVTPDIMRKMLDADNGISTSGFQLYDHGDGRVAVTLNNFCKLQAMGADDEDDILSCLEFLMADAVDARDLLGDLE